uniref:Uncharacterized protein n=1 Tax=Ananas comosus var. bracteatus TaxID=296719 RepID=A0A6V7PME1_ANACO|nr:unnamed protein product [Ananas comosus var. bracteatus]
MKSHKKSVAVSPTSPHTPANTAGISGDGSRDGTPSCHAQHHYLPAGDSPYARAKHAQYVFKFDKFKPFSRSENGFFFLKVEFVVINLFCIIFFTLQLVEKDLNKAVPLFWAAINCGDRVDSALKDMASVMKQANRADEAIEAIKSFRNRCSFQSQEALDNVLLDLYKKCGRMHEEIELLSAKLKQIDEGQAFGGRVKKLARCQGKRIHISLNKEKSRLLGNLAWAHMQLENYAEAEPLYRKALAMEPDYNKQCNLAICLMKLGRLAEAKSILADVEKLSSSDSTESYLKSFERANEILKELESEAVPLSKSEETKLEPQSTPISNHIRNVGCSNFNAECGMKYEGFSEEKSSCSELSTEYSSTLNFPSWISNSSCKKGLRKCATSQCENRKRTWVHNPYRKGESYGTCKKKLMYYAQEDFHSPVSIHGNQRAYSRESSTVSRPHANGRSSGSSRNNRCMKFEKPMEYSVTDNSVMANALVQALTPEKNTAVANARFDLWSKNSTELSTTKAQAGERDAVSETDKKEQPQCLSRASQHPASCTNSPADNRILFAYTDESSTPQEVDVLRNIGLTLENKTMESSNIDWSCDSNIGKTTQGDIVEEENLARADTFYDAAADQQRESSKDLMEKFKTATVSDGKRRTWADMVEEEEEEEFFANKNLENGEAFDRKDLLHPYSKKIESESFQDENLGSNIIKSTDNWTKKKPQSYTESVRRKPSKLDMNEGSEIALRSPRRARRSLSFHEHPIFDVSRDCLSPIGDKDTFGGSNCMAEMDNWFKGGFGLKTERTRSRLRVFQEITHDINTKG